MPSKHLTQGEEKPSVNVTLIIQSHTNAQSWPVSESKNQSHTGIVFN